MTDSLMFSHMVELDKVVSGALGVNEQSKVDMKQILAKVTVLVKRNVAQHNILKKLVGAKLQPRGAEQNCKNCARHTFLSGEQTNPGGYSSVENIPVIKATKLPSRDMTTAMCNVDKIPDAKASTLPSRDKVKFSDKNILEQFNKQPYFFGSMHDQLAWELLQEHANFGQYFMIQTEDLNFALMWKSGDGTIRQKYLDASGLEDFLNDETFGVTKLESVLQSNIQMCEQSNINIRIEPMPDKEKFRQISQSRHYRQLRKQIYCCYCQMFQNSIHLCRQKGLWFNIDQLNLVVICAETREKAEKQRFDNSSPRAQVFPTRSKMMMKLYEEAEEYWREKERQRKRKIAEANRTEEAPGVQYCHPPTPRAPQQPPPPKAPPPQAPPKLPLQSEPMGPTPEQYFLPLPIN